MVPLRRHYPRHAIPRRDLRILFDPETFYKEDTRTMYREMVHAAVLEVVDGTLEGKGLRALAPEYRKPEIRRLEG